MIPLRLDTHVALPSGDRVRVRLPQGHDRRGVAELLARLGLEAGELEIVRALRFDPLRRTVVCASLWTGMAEQTVAVGAGPRGGDRPDLLIADELLAPGAGAVVYALLVSTRARHAAA